MKPFILKSSRILLRAPTLLDAPKVTEAIVDSFPEIERWMPWANSLQTLEKSTDYIIFSEKCWSEEKPVELPMLIFDAKGENLIGSSGYHTINWELPSMEIGYWGTRQHLGQGLITEAVKLLTEYAFDTWQPKRLEIRCDVENVRSGAIATKLGYIKEAQLKNHRIQPLTQKLSDTVIYTRFTKDPL